MKYIDADKLIAEIERYKKGSAIARFDNAGENAEYFQGKVEMCDDLTHIITSLQQEQPEVDLVAELKHHLEITSKEQLEKEWKELEPWCNIGPTVHEFLYGKEPEADLEKFDKEVTKIWGKCAADPNDSIACLHIETFNEFARHFYELGLNARKEECK